MRSRKTLSPQRAKFANGFALLPKDVLTSAAWRTLGLRARAVLIEIVARHNGYNNGKVAASQRDLAAALGNVNYAAISRAIVELIEHGLVAIEADGKRWERQAREYRITWLETGAPPRLNPATNEWKGFSSDEAAASAMSITDATVSAEARTFDAAALARVREKRRK